MCETSSFDDLPFTEVSTYSLVGFDPFLPDISAEEQKSKTTSPLSLPEPSPSPDEHRESGSATREGLEKLQDELRAIASQLERESPRRKESLERMFPQAGFTPSSPLRRGLRGQKATLFSPFSKKQVLRKAESLVEHARQWKEVHQAVDTSAPRPSSLQNRSFSTPTASPSANASVLQEVWALSMKQQQEEANSPTAVASASSQAATIESLYIPTLAKHRPTSFLTGKDVVRSSEYDATTWQLDIPEKKELLVSIKVAHFLETYRSKECLLDLNSLLGYSRLNLSHFAAGHTPCGVTDIADCHRPIVESLLDCGDDIIEVRGYWHSKAVDLDQQREVFIVERQRQFLVVIRGNTAEQQGKFNKQPETVALREGHDATVFTDGFKAFRELEDKVFARLDQLTEANPFCDVIFCGHSFGASMATMAAYLYAYTRSDQRVAAYVTSSPKVGLTDFRWSVHASPNLKFMRVECGCPQRGPCSPQARHVGHTLRISPNKQAKAYKFSPGPVELSVRSRLFKRERDISDYVQALEELPTWVQDYHKEDGVGVRGKDNETRHVV
jgi:pimeloyl-ACP methyl ester carboxylesterase